MFTGLVEEIGAVKSIGPRDDHFDLVVEASTVLDDAMLGDSISVNGVCLTVTALNDQSFTAGLAPETLNRTNLGDLNPGDGVNLERSVTPTTRMGGHYVQGHVDGAGEIISIKPDRDALWFTFRTDPAMMRYIVTKGYVAIDGASLTVVDTGPDWFNITLIDYTQGKVILPRKKPGERVNLEVDILAKYVERLVTNTSAPTPEFAKEGVR